MGDRIKALEEVIEKFQASVSTETHPLLRAELLNIKFPPGLSIPADKRDKATFELANALGTLTLDENGSTKYFGSSAGTEVCTSVTRHLLLVLLTVTYLRRCSWYARLFLLRTRIRITLKAGAEAQSRSYFTDQPSFSTPSFKSIPGLNADFRIKPNSEWDIPKCLPILYTYLPPKPRAWMLCETYFRYGSRDGGQMLTRAEFVDDIMGPLYRHLEERKEGLGTDSNPPVPCTKLASLFIGQQTGTPSLTPSDIMQYLPLGPFLISPYHHTVQRPTHSSMSESQCSISTPYSARRILARYRRCS
jgi:hypothetical protein